MSITGLNLFVLRFLSLRSATSPFSFTTLTDGRVWATRHSRPRANKLRRCEEVEEGGEEAGRGRQEDAIKPVKAKRNGTPHASPTYLTGTFDAPPSGAAAESSLVPLFLDCP